MPANSNPLPVFPEHVISWLENYLEGDMTCALITNHPWAQTYRLESSQAVYFLKVLPPAQRLVLPAIELLSRHCSDHVPEVRSHSVDHGLLLLCDHRGEAASPNQHSDLDRRILEAYAKLQAHASSNSDLLASLPFHAPSDLSQRFLNFFEGTPNANGELTSEYFLGSDDSKKYADLLRMRLPLLAELIQRAIEKLPNTVNHGDLRYKNTAIRSDQSIVLFDWDDMTAGPAGYSLHNFFSGCLCPAAMLLNLPSAASATVDQRRLLDTYIAALNRHGYASTEDLQYGLPGAFALGVMSYILSYAKFTVDSHEERRVIAKILLRRTDDLLKLCNELSLSNRDQVLGFSSDHLSRGDFHDAEQLLQRYLALHPQDHELRHHYASSLYERGDNSKAIHQCRIGLELDPCNPSLRRLAGDCALEDLNLDAAIDHWNLAMDQSPQSSKLRNWIAEIQILRNDIQSLDTSDAVPTVRLTDVTLDSRTLTRLKLRIASRLFREFGTLLIENAFSPKLLSKLHSDFLYKYNPVLEGGNVENALKVGRDRYMMTIEIEGAFNSPDLYANHFLHKLFQRLLGNDFVLGSFTAVASLAGAPDMRVHKDHPALFPEDITSLKMPTFAITVLLPLLGMSSELGTTRIVKGSHRKSSEDSASMPHQDPLGPVGSCLLMDYRLTHQGLANRSNQVRPVLSMVYNRPWFRDAVNYRKQPPLSITRDEFAHIPEPFQPLLSWYLPTGDQVAN
jgi:tetratricopeptide (TPR) repeat protein